MQGLYYGYLSALKKHAPNKPELKSLYQIHSAIAVWLRMFTLIEAGKLNPEQDFYSLNPYVEQLMDTIYSSIDKLKTYALSFALDPFLDKTPDVIRPLLLKEEIFQMNASASSVKFGVRCCRGQNGWHANRRY